MSNNRVIDDILQVHEELKQRRVYFDDTWEEISEYIIPRREGFKGKSRKKGRRYGENIYDTTAVKACQTAADGTQGHMVSPSFQWLQLIMREWRDEHDVRDWLQESTEQIYLALNDTNFYQSMNEFLLDGWTIGTATMFINEDIASGKLVFRTIHPREIYIAENENGAVDTIHRAFTLTARQAVRMFGEYCDSITRLAEKTPHADVEFLHVVDPRYDRNSWETDAMNMPWRSIYIDVMHQELVEESGFKRLPYAVWRFRKNSDEEYGRSPAWDALRDVKVLNAKQEAKLVMDEYAARPVRFVPYEYLDEWEFIPSAVNGYKDSQKPPVPYAETQNYQILLNDIQEYQDRVNKHFWVDFWQLLSSMMDRTKTATEVIEIQNEKLAILTATIGRYTHEGLDPVVDIVFGIERDAGRMPEPPAIILENGATIDTDYMGPLNQALKRLSAVGTQQAIGQVAQIAQLDPNVLIRFDLEQAAVKIAESHGIDQDLVRDDKAVAKIIKQRQEAAQAQAAAQQQAEVMRGVNPNEPVQEGSLFSQMMAANA